MLTSSRHCRHSCHQNLSHLMESNLGESSGVCRWEKTTEAVTEQAFERQTELSLHREIGERWNVPGRQRMAAVLSLQFKLCSKVLRCWKNEVRRKLNLPNPMFFGKHVNQSHIFDSCFFFKAGRFFIFFQVVKVNSCIQAALLACAHQGLGRHNVKLVTLSFVFANVASATLRFRCALWPKTWRRSSSEARLTSHSYAN